MENNEVEEYESYVFKLKINLKDKRICGQKYLNIKMFDSCFGEQDTDYYVPIVGTVEGTNDLCYGVRCCEDNMVFKIYEKATKTVYLVYIVDNIATTIEVNSPDILTKSPQYQFCKVIERGEDVEKVDLNQTLKIMQSYANTDANTAFENEFSADFTYKDELFDMMSENLTGMARAIYFPIVNNFLVKFNLHSLSVLTDNKKIIKIFDKCKDEYDDIDPRKYDKLIENISVEDWFELYKSVKEQLPNYQVFADIPETAYDVFSYGIDAENNCEYTYRF